MILANFVPIIETSKKDEVVLVKKILYIPYPLYFYKDTAEIKALFNSGNKVNAMIPAYIAKIGPKVCFINIVAQKINSSTFNIFEIVLASFQVEDKLR